MAVSAENGFLKNRVVANVWGLSIRGSILFGSIFLLPLVYTWLRNNPSGRSVGTLRRHGRNTAYYDVFFSGPKTIQQYMPYCVLLSGPPPHRRTPIEMRAYIVQAIKPSVALWHGAETWIERHATAQ